MPVIDLTIVLSICCGVGIAAACGLRAFLPLFLLGLAGRFDLLPLRDAAAWLSSTHALVALGVATAIEIAGDKIPLVDHALDAIGTLVRPAAAWLGAFAVFAGLPAPWAQLAAIFVGASALAVHAAKAHMRIGSTALTLGAANPLVSIVEDAVAAAMTVVALLAPLVVVVVVAASAVLAARAIGRASRPA